MNPASRFLTRAGRARCASVLLLAFLHLSLPAAPRAAAEARWVASWAAAPQDYLKAPLLPGIQTSPPGAPVPVFGNQSLRQRVSPTLGGERVRVRFSNLFGKGPLRILGASVARSTGADAVSPATLQRLRFGDADEVTIAPGEERWSDGARLGVEPGQAVAVSFQLEAPTPFATVHHLGTTTLVPGSALMRPQWRDAAPSSWNHVVTGLDVASPGTPRVVVGFGDSITQGVGVEQSQALPSRYPDRLAARVREQPGQAGSVAIINAGIAGNRLLTDGVGPRGIERFRRDVLAQSGVSHALILIGINDIGLSLPIAMQGLAPVLRPPSAEQITAGLQQLVDEAHARGVKVLLGTLTPFKGAATWTEEKEARRQAVNRWIRGRQDVDAVVDFDAALRDPADHAALHPHYDSGDHLHPGNAGYAAMADAIDLRVLQE
ncbi:SGNH/GDSL hydrolase family protein [Variovorax paradoxus]|nr:SGNH/GDSL hydrolase family protein [Variovorax paradoxus]